MLGYLAICFSFYERFGRHTDFQHNSTYLQRAICLIMKSPPFIRMPMLNRENVRLALVYVCVAANYYFHKWTRLYIINFPKWENISQWNYWLISFFAQNLICDFIIKFFWGNNNFIRVNLQDHHTQNKTILGGDNNDLKCILNRENNAFYSLSEPKSN